MNPDPSLRPRSNALLATENQKHLKNPFNPAFDTFFDLNSLILSVSQLLDSSFTDDHIAQIPQSLIKYN